MVHTIHYMVSSNSSKTLILYKSICVCKILYLELKEKIHMHLKITYSDHTNVAIVLQISIQLFALPVTYGVQGSVKIQEISELCFLIKYSK